MVKKLLCQKVLIICLLVINLCCVVGGGIITIQAAESKNFYYTLVEQAKSKWCWAACAENSVRNEMTVSRDQYSAVRKLKGNIFVPYPNATGSLADIEKAAEYISKGTEEYKRTSVSKTSGAKSFEFLKNQVKNNDVTILSSGYYNKNGERDGGHACVCVGYWIYNDGSEFICIYDPWDGTRKEVRYTTFKNKYESRIYDGTVWNAE